MCRDEANVISEKSVSEIIHKSSIGETIKGVARFTLLQMRNCCNKILNSLIVSDPLKLCYETAKHHKLWRDALQLRTSGSRIYSLYTYSKNKNPNWEQNSRKYFWPKDFINKFVKHGLTQEQFVRLANLYRWRTMFTNLESMHPYKVAVNYLSV